MTLASMGSCGESPRKRDCNNNPCPGADSLGDDVQLIPSSPTLMTGSTPALPGCGHSGHRSHPPLGKFPQALAELAWGANELRCSAAPTCVLSRVSPPQGVHSQDRTLKTHQYVDL
jgi:hypothetical protein